MSSAEKDELTVDGEETLFPKGSVVEVSSDQEGFDGAWYVATVIRTPLDSNKTYKTTSLSLKYLVQYHTLLADEEDGSEPLRESVDVSFLRPVFPADDQDHSFALNDVVDAFHRDGWWTGVITGVVGGDVGHSKYVVCFQNPPEEIEFTRSELRVHREWVDGKWVRPDCQEIKNLLSDNQEQLGHTLNNPKIAETPIQLKSSFNSTKRKQKPTTTDTSAMSSRPWKRLRKQNTEEAPLALSPCENMSTPIRSLSKEALSGLTTSATGGTRSDCSKKSVVGDTLFAKTKSSQGKKFKQKPATPDTSAMSSRPLKKLRKQNTEEAPVSLTPCENMTTPIRSLSPLKKLRKQNTEEAPVSLTPCEKMITPIRSLSKEALSGLTRSAKGGTRSDCSKKSVVGDSLFETKSSQGKKFETSEPKVGVSSDRKRRGRPPKLSIEEPKEGENNSQRGKKKGRPPKSLIEEVMEDSEDGIRSKTPDVSEMDYSTKDVETVIEELRGNVFDDRPLLTWLEGTESLTTVEDSRVFPETIVNQCDEASARQDEIEIHSPAIASTIDQDTEASERRDGTAMQCTTVSASGDGAVDMNQSLPFKKYSPIWESVESMEVFKIMPQNPHFSPLDDCKEDIREGLAIGKMVTFANIVERTSKLQHTDPKSIIDQSLETLSDLKIHGFDVESVQTRLNELLLTKERQEQLEEELKEAERKMMIHDLERHKFDGEIQEIAKTITELQEKLELATTKKEMEDSVSVKLESKLVLISGDLMKVKVDFEKLATSPW